MARGLKGVRVSIFAFRALTPLRPWARHQGARQVAFDNSDSAAMVCRLFNHIENSTDGEVCVWQ